MARIDWDAEGGRIPIWEHPHLLTRIAAKESLLYSEHVALELNEGDPRPNSNFHDLWLGPSSVLREHGTYVFDRVRSECGLGSYDFWGNQREWLRAAFHAFYGREDALAILSITSIRRPATLRQRDDPTLRIRQDPTRFHLFRALRSLEKAPLQIGDFQLPAQGLLLASHPDAPKRRAELAQVVVPRLVQSSRHSIIRSYQEFWYAVAQRGDDDIWLRQGRIPALGARPYQKNLVSLRTTIMVSLARVSPKLTHSLFVIEIHPETGEVLSLRWIRTPLAVALATAAPAEHLAICEILRERVG
jgi:hypothetical protein